MNLISSLAVSRLALLQQMEIPNEASRADALMAETSPHASQTVDNTLVRHSSLWITVGKNLAARWWSNNPINMALQIAEPVLRPYAQRNPVLVVGVAAGAGALLLLLRPWRLVSIASVAMLFIRAPKIPALALHLVKASTDSLHNTEQAITLKANDSSRGDRPSI